MRWNKIAQIWPKDEKKFVRENILREVKNNNAAF